MTSTEVKAPLAVYGLIVAIFGVFTALGIIGWQVYVYLQSGEWTTVSVIDALSWLDVSWAIYPQSWFGLHKLLIKVPLSLAFFLTSIFFFLATTTREK